MKYSISLALLFGTFALSPWVGQAQAGSSDSSSMGTGNQGGSTGSYGTSTDSGTRYKGSSGHVNTRGRSGSGASGSGSGR